MLTNGVKSSIMKWRGANTTAYNEYMSDYMRNKYNSDDKVKQRRMERYYSKVAYSQEVKRFSKINCF